MGTCNARGARDWSRERVGMKRGSGGSGGGGGRREDGKEGMGHE